MDDIWLSALYTMKPLFQSCFISPQSYRCPCFNCSLEIVTMSSDRPVMSFCLLALDVYATAVEGLGMVEGKVWTGRGS